MTAMGKGSTHALSMVVLALLVALPLSVSSADDVRATIVQQKSGTQATLMGVYFRNAALGWAVGGGGTLLKTVDGGRKWKKVLSGTSTLLTAVLFVDDRKGWAVGDAGTLLETPDGGETWVQQGLASQTPLNALN